MNNAEYVCSSEYTVRAGAIDMSILNQKDELSLLPDEVKAMVNGGVYSLYSISHASAKFLLITDRREMYLLSQEGSIISKATDLTGIALIEPKKFANISGTVSGNVLKVNYA